MEENLSDHRIVREIIFCKTSIKLFIMRTILWMIKFSVIVHLCVENSFSWRNSLFLFFHLKHQIDWYIKHTKSIFWEFHVASIVDYYAIIKNKNNNHRKLLLSQFVSVIWVCNNKWKLWRYSVLVILLKAITFQEFLC